MAVIGGRVEVLRIHRIWPTKELNGLHEMNFKAFSQGFISLGRKLLFLLFFFLIKIIGFFLVLNRSSTSNFYFGKKKKKKKNGINVSIFHAAEVDIS